MKAELLWRAVLVALLRRPYLHRDDLLDARALAKLQETHTPGWNLVAVQTNEALEALSARLHENLGGDEGLADLRFGLVDVAGGWFLTLLGIVLTPLLLLEPDPSPIAPLLMLLPLAVWLRSVWMLNKVHKGETVKGFAMLCEGEIRARQQRSHMQPAANIDKLLAHHLIVCWRAAALACDVQQTALATKMFRVYSEAFAEYGCDMLLWCLDVAEAAECGIPVIGITVALFRYAWAMRSVRNITTFVTAKAVPFGNMYNLPHDGAGSKTAARIRDVARWGPCTRRAFWARTLTCIILVTPAMLLAALFRNGWLAGYAICTIILHMLSWRYWKPLFKAKDGVRHQGCEFIRRGGVGDDIDQITGLALAALDALETVPLPSSRFEGLLWNNVVPAGDQPAHAGVVQVIVQIAEVVLE